MYTFWDCSVDGSLLTSARNNGAIGLFTGQVAHLGVQFTRNAETHYGYLYLDVSFVGANAGNLLALAWDTRPNAAIVAGAVREPSTWVLLSVGVLAIGMLRRRR